MFFKPCLIAFCFLVKGVSASAVPAPSGAGGSHFAMQVFQLVWFATKTLQEKLMNKVLKVFVEPILNPIATSFIKRTRPEPTTLEKKSAMPSISISNVKNVRPRSNEYVSGYKADDEREED
jgi:hypothetical protein